MRPTGAKYAEFWRIHILSLVAVRLCKIFPRKICVSKKSKRVKNSTRYMGKENKERGKERAACSLVSPALLLGLWLVACTYFTSSVPYDNIACFFVKTLLVRSMFSRGTPITKNPLWWSCWWMVGALFAFVISHQISIDQRYLAPSPFLNSAASSSCTSGKEPNLDVLEQNLETSISSDGWPALLVLSNYIAPNTTTAPSRHSHHIPLPPTPTPPQQFGRVNSRP